MKNISVKIEKAVEEKRLNVWENYGKKRYYVSSSSKEIMKYRAYLSVERETKPKYEEQLENCYLYMEKCYNDYEGAVEKILNYIDGK